MTKDKIFFDSLHVESVSFYKIKAKIQCKTITALHDLKINDNCECDSQSAEKKSTGGILIFLFFIIGLGICYIFINNIYIYLR